jgi:hypothetical protein
MVNNENPYLKLYSKLSEPPAVDDTDSGDRSIENGPIWDLNELIKLATQDGGTNLRIVTSKAKKNYEELLENGFDLPSTLKLINAKRDYKGSFWCKTSSVKDKNGKPRGSGAWIPCDSYAVVCDYQHPITGHAGTAEYYFKMCKGLDGKTVLFVSIHL